jgi:hypothetical protein
MNPDALFNGNDASFDLRRTKIASKLQAEGYEDLVGWEMEGDDAVCTMDACFAARIFFDDKFAAMRSFVYCRRACWLEVRFSNRPS